MTQNKIPKVIHYCWFGRGDKPRIVNQCIDSWKKAMPDYEIREWNEDNFNICCNDYVSEAYEAKKYAFVSDYVRVYVLYKYGGIYMDTDVEVVKNFDQFLGDKSFWGFEAGNYVATSTIGAASGNKLIEMFLNSYKNEKFLKEEGDFNVTTNVSVVSDMVKKIGVMLNGEFQTVRGIGSFYPMNVFSPYDYRYFKLYKDDKTVTIHHFYKSWLPFRVRMKQNIKKVVIRILGIKKFKCLVGRS